MDNISVLLLITGAFTDFGGAVLVILGAFLALAVAYLVFKFGLGLIWHWDGTSNWLGKHWSAWDKITYSPYKGYNRFRSRKWNMAHMP